MFRLHQELLLPPRLVHNEPRWSSLSVDALEAPAQLVQTTGGLCVCVCVCPADRSVLTVTNVSDRQTSELSFPVFLLRCCFSNLPSE